MDAVRTPLDHAPALELGNKLWRKEIIKQGTIHYAGGKFDANAAYLDAVYAAYQDGAIGSVPFTFVDDKGAHVEAPERRKGNIVGLERTATGLDAILSLDPDADELVRKDKKFGVSVLIKHDRVTGGGKRYPAVLAHVAGTYDPVINDLGDWEEIAASNDAGDVLDLLALTTTTGDATVADTLTPEETAALRSIASLAPMLVQLAEASNTPDPGVDETAGREFTDADIEQLADDLDADTEVEAPELIAASQTASDEVLALSQQVAAERQARQDIELRLAQSEKREAVTAYEAERLALAQRYGIAPRVTDIVRPLLEGTAGRALALANGDQIDAATLIRTFVAELATTPRLDLSQTQGSALDFDADAEATRKKENEAFLARAAAELNH